MRQYYNTGVAVCVAHSMTIIPVSLLSVRKWGKVQLKLRKFALFLHCSHWCKLGHRLGPFLVGVALSLVLYGILVTQIQNYFSKYKGYVHRHLCLNAVTYYICGRDRLWMKIMVSEKVSDAPCVLQLILLNIWSDRILILCWHGELRIHCGFSVRDLNPPFRFVMQFLSLPTVDV